MGHRACFPGRVKKRNTFLLTMRFMDPEMETRYSVEKEELVPEVLDAVEDRQRFMEAGFSLHIYPLLLSRIIWGGAEEMAQWFRALTPLPEDMGSSPRTHTAAHTCL